MNSYLRSGEHNFPSPTKPLANGPNKLEGIFKNYKYKLCKNITITSGMTKSPTVFPYNPRLSFTKFDKGDTEPYVCAQGYRRPLEQHKHVLKEEQG